MRALFLFLLIAPVLLACVAHAEPEDRFRAPRSKAEVPKPRAQRAPANPCAAYGPGFARIEGTETCIKIGGSIGISGGVGGNSVMPR